MHYLKFSKVNIFQYIYIPKGNTTSLNGLQKKTLTLLCNSFYIRCVKNQIMRINMHEFSVMSIFSHIGVNCSEIIGHQNCSKGCKEGACVQVSSTSYRCECFTGYTGKYECKFCLKSKTFRLQTLIDSYCYALYNRVIFLQRSSNGCLIFYCLASFDSLCFDNESCD